MANLWPDTSEYPFQSHYFFVNGVNLHYIDEGKGETILFIHGTPSWSFDFRNVIKRLRTRYRCIAIDHVGFGLSGKPAGYDYSTQAHSKTLERFVLENQLHDITLVVHDFGGPIGLNFAIHHPGKIKRLVILNSWLWSSEAEPGFIRMSRILKSPLLPLLYRYFNFSPRYLLPRSFGYRKLPKRLLQQYTRPFASHRQRNGVIAFAGSLLHDQDWFETLWHKREAISAKPTLFIWGMKDPLVTPHYLDRFEKGFTHSTTLRLETAGHFPQEEQPGEVAERIVDFMENDDERSNLEQAVD